MAFPTDRPLEILVCNDDGITAGGIIALAEVAREFGNVTVVAPDGPQSGMGHAISIGRPLRLNRHLFPTEAPAWACSGTPVDCIKLARAEIYKGKPDLVLSGINHGANSSISVLYSGTMSAAVEGAIENIPSIGFSLCDYSTMADFTVAKQVARRVIQHVLQQPFPPYTALNVNIPKVDAANYKGIRVCRQAIGRFVEEFDKRTDPYQRDYFWLTGSFQLDDAGEDTDVWALENGYASLVPVSIDMTAHHLLQSLHTWGL
jgi:5'-nucleotidase